jgi:hypothetical protein
MRGRNFVRTHLVPRFHQYITAYGKSHNLLIERPRLHTYILVHMYAKVHSHPEFGFYKAQVIFKSNEKTAGLYTRPRRPPPPRTRTTVYMQWRAGAAIASTGGNVYVCGGYANQKALRSAERFDLRTKSWTLVAKMKQRRMGAQAVTLGGRIYVIGGTNGKHVYNSIEAYDVTTNSWSAGSSMLVPRHSHSCCIFKVCFPQICMYIHARSTVSTFPTAHTYATMMMIIV